MKQTTEQDSIRLPWSVDDRVELDAAPFPPASVPCAGDIDGAAPCEMTPTHHLTGRVVDDEGRPVQGFLVVVHWRPGSGCSRDAGSTLITTDEDGRYATPIRCCGHVLVSFEEDNRHFRQEDFCSRLIPEDEPIPWFEPVRFDEDAEWPEAVVTRTRTISGRVLDEHRKPIADATVTVISDDVVSDEAHFFKATTHTDGTGLFSLSGLKITDGELIVSGPTETHSLVVLQVGGIDQGADLSFGGGWLIGDLEVRVPAAAPVRMTLVDDLGRGLPHVSLRPVPLDDPLPHVFVPMICFTDEVGCVCINRLPVGRYRFEVSRPSDRVVRRGDPTHGVCEFPEYQWTPMSPQVVCVGQDGELVLECRL